MYWLSVSLLPSGNCACMMWASLLVVADAVGSRSVNWIPGYAAYIQKYFTFSYAIILISAVDTKKLSHKEDKEIKFIIKTMDAFCY